LTAVDLLFDEGLEIVSSDVGGNEGRKIFLFSETGDVYLSRLGKLGSEKDE
jgi:chemotaxis receptor (MCP) glutamine deamidase CheD